MTSPIGKLLLQYTKLPLDVIQYCIEPCFGVTEEEVKDNRKKLVMEMEWLFEFGAFSMWYRQPDRRHVFCPRARAMAYTRKVTVQYIRTTYPISINDFILDGIKVTFLRRMLECNEYIATLPLAWIKEVVIPSKSWLQRCLEWLNLSDGSAYLQTVKIKVNLKTKDVLIYDYYGEDYGV